MYEPNKQTIVTITIALYISFEYLFIITPRQISIYVCKYKRFWLELQDAEWFIFHILDEGGDVVDGRIVDIMLELADA